MENKAINFLLDVDFNNEIVEKNLTIGDSSLLPFKKIIKRVMYPSDFSAIKFELFNDLIDAYQSMGGDKEGTLELKVYGLESLIHYTLDTYDLEDELYFIAKEMLDSIIDGVSKSEAKQKYISRLLELKEYVKHSERYHDRLVMEPGASCVV